MPPFVGRKRLSHSPPPSTQPAPKRAKLADALDSTATPASLSKNRTFSLGSDSDSSLSDINSDEFEDVTVNNETSNMTKNASKEESEEDDDVEWEDAAGNTIENEQRPIQDLQINIRKDNDFVDYGTAARAGSGKKGPSKREKLARVQTHQMHVQFLLWHNAIRNSWIGDDTVQDHLVKELPIPIAREVEKWRRASGLVSEPTPPTKAKGKKVKKNKHGDSRTQRDWGRPSSRLDPGKADVSRGDPLISLMKVLSAYWKKRFAITAPGMRKRGYGTKHGLKQDISSYRNEEHDPSKHGERIRNLDEFRARANRCEGSRDLGAQLFTALLRGLGIEARLVASLQPAGYGWTKAEQMAPRKLEANDQAEDSGRDESTFSDEVSPKNPTKVSSGNARKPKPNKPRTMPHRSTGKKDSPIDLDDNEEVANCENTSADDDESIIDVTPSMPKARPAKFDRDLPFPIYWTEVISPVTQKVLPVSPLVLQSPVASTPEALAQFEPRGAKADKARLVISYVVAHSSDGTAKDVTVRYIRKRIWPGKTKAFRYPIEKIPVYDKRGRIKRHEDYDWFKHVMMSYTRSDDKRTAVDDLEDATDLVPAEPEKKQEAEVDTQQSLRSSAEFCLERFLRREEALKSGAQPVRTFVSGKGDNLKEEPVYKRSDVERCLTAESWHKEGRRPIQGETALKLVPVRAVTLARKREAEEHQARTGEKQMQGLYSWDQTEWIIPPPIKNGIIPKNSYGNIDCFVPSMVPKGAVHVPLKGTVRLCKKLEIDYAEAVVGFEFGNKMAVPVINGVVIAKENEQMLRDAWRTWSEEQRKKEETKMEKLVLDLWRKFIIGLRIRERVQDTYGESADTDSRQEMVRGRTKEQPIDVDAGANIAESKRQEAGGFEQMQPEHNQVDDEEDFGGGFLLPHEDEIAAPEELVMEDHISSQKAVRQGQTSRNVSDSAAQYPTPTSATAPSKQKRATAGTSTHKSLLRDSAEDRSSPSPSSLSELGSEADSASSESEQQSSMSDQLDSNDDDNDDEIDEYTPQLKRQAAVNKDVKLTPTRRMPARNLTRRSATKVNSRAQSTPNRSKRATGKNATPVKSPYFDSK